MKKLNFYKINLLAVLLVLTGSILTACDKTEFDARPIDESGYEVSDTQGGILLDENGKANFSTVEMKVGGSGKLLVSVRANKQLDTDSEVTLAYSEAVLNQYNAETGNEYRVYPAGNVMLDGDATLILKAKTQETERLTVTFTATDGMKEGETYVIPLEATVKSGSLSFSKENARFLIFVKVLSNPGDCNKGDGAVKLFSVIETNDTNPLNHLCFTLKKSKKYLFDGVVLFSDNIVLDQETGTVHALFNDNIVKILNNSDKYIKPLRDRGIKVVLGIMAHHTHASIANLKPETASAFARELKTICDTYQLDGIFYDDEYDVPSVPTPPGFYAQKSSEAAARLMYEVKSLMPDRLNIAYALAKLYDMSSEGCVIEGKGPDYYTDYIMCNYGLDWGFDFATNYPGISPRKWGMYSQEFRLGGWCREDAKLEQIKKNQGVHFVFGLDPFVRQFNEPWANNNPNPSGSTQRAQLEQIARVFYDDELVYDEKPYSKDW